MVRITIATFLRHIINRLNFATSSNSGTKQALKIYIMSDVKTFMFPDSGTRSGGLDPNALLAMMNNGGGFGANGNWIWVIFLFFLYGWNRNGLFGGKLMQCLEDLEDNQRGGDRDDWDDNEYEEEEDYGRYGRMGARKQKRSGRYMR